MYAELGSICSGSLRPEDLIPAFTDALEGIKLRLARLVIDTMTAEEAEDIKAAIDEIDELLSDVPGNLDDVDALTDKLSEYAPPFCYFGAHEGDGADFGFWFSRDSFNDACRYGEVLKLSAGDEWPDELGEAEYVAEVTDHGNVTLYSRDHTEIWSIV